MGKGRGSAFITAATMVVAILAVLGSEIVAAAAAAQGGVYHNVGAARGWSFHTDTWPKTQTFKAGDTLVFTYNPQFHNVVAVDSDGYKNCKTPPGAKIYKSGKDQIKVVKGNNFFICNFPAHCESGMKIAVNAP